MTMKVTTDRDMKEIRHNGTNQRSKNEDEKITHSGNMNNKMKILRRHITILILLLLSCLFSKALAADDIIYHIINNQGKECFRYVIKGSYNYTSIDKTRFCVHPWARSMVATNFRFYINKADAEADAAGTIDFYYKEGDTISKVANGTKEFYVRYSMKTQDELVSEGFTYDPEGNMTYLMQIRERSAKGGKRRQAYYDAETNDKRFEFGKPGSNNTDIPNPDPEVEGGGDGNLQTALPYRFRFDTKGDAYGVYIYNGAAEGVNANGVLTADGVGRENTDAIKQRIATYEDIISDYDPEKATKLQTFFFVAANKYILQESWKGQWEGKVFIVGALGGLDYVMRDTSNPATGGDEANIPYFLCANGDPKASGTFTNEKAYPDGFQLQCFRSWRAMDCKSDNIALIKTTMYENTHKVTYHIVNSANTSKDVLTIVQRHGLHSPFNLSNRDKLQRIGCTLSTDYYSDRACTVKYTGLVGDATDVYIPYTFYAEATKEATNLEFSTEENPKWFSVDIRDSGNKLLTYDATNNVIDSRNEPKDTTRIKKESQFAFIGDPYSFRVICKGADGKYAYLDTETINIYGANVADNVRFTSSPTDNMDCWAMVEGTTSNKFQIFLRDAYAATKRAFWDARDKGNEIRMWTQTGNNAEIAASSNIRVTPAPEYDYTYNIVDNKGRIAIKYTVKQEVSHRLDGEHGHKAIPSAIYSPYIEGETLTFYKTYTAGTGAVSNPVTMLPNGKANTPTDIYVRYTNAKLSTRRYLLDGTKSYFMQLGDRYVVYSSGVKTQTERPSIEEVGKELKIWTLYNSDPYDVEVRNTGEGNHKLLDDTEIHFIIMDGAGTAEGQVELLFANKADISTPANSRSLELNTDNVINATTVRGNLNQQVIFYEAVLERTYRLLDKKGRILLEYEGRKLPNNGRDLGVLDKWVSPLVKEYHYWARSSFTLSGDTYTLKDGEHEIETPQGSTDGYIYVTYDALTSDDEGFVDLDGRNSNTKYMYLLRFKNGESFQQEMNDQFRESSTTKSLYPSAGHATKAVYPYSNGEANFYIYGAEQWEEQQYVASSRTRWSWYLEGNDPYRTKISSFQTQTSQTVNGSTVNRHAYFRTYKPYETYNGYVTGSIADNTLVDDGSAPSEYMILGTKGDYKLVTSDELGTDPGGYGGTNHREVNSFEQYWKNNPTVLELLYKHKGYTDDKTDAGKKRRSDYAEELNERDLTDDEITYMTTVSSPNWHHYQAWANINSWTSTSSKKYQKTDHWFQTIHMDYDATKNDYSASPVFDFERVDLNGVLVLIDSHGWEVARKPMGRLDNKTAKAELDKEIRKYDSPMVEEYTFWTLFDKESGYHKYKPHTGESNDSKNSKAAGTGKSLTDYPEVKSNGMLQDIYVTYTVKPQYADTYTPDSVKEKTKVKTSFLIRQGGVLAKANENGTAIDPDATHISNIDAGSVSLTSTSDPEYFWCLRPNFDIDVEMGYYDVANRPDHSIKAEKRDSVEGSYIKHTITSRNNNFDPYNVQIYSYKSYKDHETNSENAIKYFVTNAGNAVMQNRQHLEATSPAGGHTLSLGNNTTTKFTANVSDYDGSNIFSTNATFLVVQDENGNMRLMPRFDHSRVINGFTTLTTPAEAQPEEDKKHEQSTWLLRPPAQVYIIVDNQGREALRYTSLNDGAPVIPAKYRSPLATNFGFYKTLEETGTDTHVYKLETLADSITTFDAAGLSEGGTVYVRYKYDPAADTDGLLKGTWYHAKLNDADVEVATTGVIKKSLGGSSDEEKKAHRWRFMQSAGDDSDPYAVTLWNGTPATESSGNRYIVFRHSDYTDENRSYALMQAGTITANSYSFLDGDGEGAHSIAEQTNYISGTAEVLPGTIDATKKLTLTPVLATDKLTYKIITKSGIVALASDEETEITDSYKLKLPVWMESPLMASDAYIFYSAAEAKSDGTYIIKGQATTTPKSLDGDVVYVHYDYEKSKKAVTSFQMPDLDGLPYNYAPLDLSGKVMYTIGISSNDNGKMWSANTTTGAITQADIKASTELTAPARLWRFTGNDPYEVTIHPSISETAVLAARDPDPDAKYKNENNEVIKPNDRYPVVYVKEPGDVTFKDTTFMVLKANPNEVTTSNNRHRKGTLKFYLTGKDTQYLAESNSLAGGVYVYTDKDPDTGNDIHYQDRLLASGEPINPVDKILKPDDPMIIYSNFFYRPVLTYHIITNDKKEALKGYSLMAGTTVEIPEVYQSPLLNSSDFTYYTKATVDGSDYTVDEKATTTASSTIASVVAKSIGDIYVRYKYDPATSPFKIATSIDDNADDGTRLSWIDEKGLDLTGNTWYTIANMQRNWTSDEHGRVFGATDNTTDYQTLTVKSLPNGRAPSQTEYLWKLEGKDPYAIRIYSAKHNKYLSVDNSNRNITLLDKDQAGNTQTFMLLEATATDNQASRMSAYQLKRWTVLMTTGSNYFTPCTTTGNGSTSSLKARNTWVANNYAEYQIRMSGSKEVTRKVYNMGGGGTTEYCIEFIKAPVSRKYHYHAIQYDGSGNKVGQTWDAILEHDWLQDVVLDEVIARQYCKYEKKSTTFYGTDNVNVTPTNEFVNRFTVKDTVQFYHDADFTERIRDVKSGKFDIYPEIGLNEVYDIYFKYQIDPEAQLSGRTLSDMTSTQAGIDADVAYYNDPNRGNGHMGVGYSQQAKWFFMVLDTDKDITATGTGDKRTFTGNQYFLRREDNGTVSWMNNAYTLHKYDEDNYKEWSYNRLAEWYRKGDNDAYREGRWLWAFVGDDPYNMRIVNFESAVGVTAEGYNVYTLDGADKCYTTIRKNTSDAGTVSYPVTIPTSEPSENQYWGICVGVNKSEEETFSLLSTSITEETDDIKVSKPLYWHMVSRTANKVTTESVEGLLDYITGQSYAIQLLPYKPVKYQDINLVIKRDDHVAHYTGTWKHDNPSATEDQKKAQLMTYDSGISLLYFTANERTYVKGDKIDLRTEFSLPYNVRRAFCDYKLYRDDYSTLPTEAEPYYTVTDGPYPTTTQATTNGVWSGTGTSEDPYVYSSAGDRIYDEDGKPVWTYVDKDGKPASGAQSIYVEYKVTSDIFLKEAPNYDEVQTMLANNDHVYFMDFPTTDSKGNEITHHAFYDPEATTFIQTGDLSKNKDKNTGIWVPEKKSWNESSKTYVSDFSNSYNNLQYRTVNDRMESTPDYLKWYFVGDPYKVQVFNTAGVWNTAALKDENGNVIMDTSKEPAEVAYPANTVNAQLARYNPVETNFQFVSDCVHLRLPDYTKIDRREELVPTDEYGVAMPDKTFNNRNFNKPYINDFYWEVMPAASDKTGTFALRFKEDNELMGYRNVYYYLAREGLTKSYQVEEENPDVYHINLSYNADNERYESGKYLGYHKANNENSTIKLVQPVKVYITANRVDERFGNETNVVKDEYSGYYGLGETITGVPRHLQRKYVMYGSLSDKNGTTMGEHFLTEGNAYNYPLTECSAHSSNVFKTGTKINPVFKFSVDYSVADLTANGVHLFTKAANPTAPTQAEITWLDVKISNSSWLYYDKTNKDDSGVENKMDVVSNYRRAMNDPKNEGWNSEADGWNDGLKGLHWAFVGDPYDFTILNRRRYEDNTINTSPMWFAATKQTIDNYNGTVPNDSVVWTATLVDNINSYTTNTSTATAGLANDINAHWSLQMWKTGGDSDFFLRTASLLNQSVIDGGGDRDIQTDNYWRMAARTSTISDVSYEFEAIPYSLSNKNRWTSNKGYLDWNTYVTNGTGYSQSSSGMGVKEQLIQICTATNKDNDQADNNCFDAKIQIVTKKGVKRIEKDNLEIKYGIAADMLPYSLRRYGCTYECYINYVSPENPGTLLYRLRDSNVPMDEAESWSTSTQEYDDLTAAITAAKEAHAADPGKSPNVTLTYVYDMEEEVAPYFTTESNALIDEYTWMNTYFEWEQIYTGTNVEVEYYEDVFDHYVYNAQGQIVDAVYVKERKTKIVKNPTTPYITDAFLNSHTTQTAIYADQSVQTEKDQQKWSLVGDPYSFKMINYDQYLKNQNSKLTLDGNNVVASNISSQNFDLAVDAKGNTYLGIFDGTGEDGNADVKHFINFTYSASSDKSLHYENAAVINDNDPTGNTLKTKNIKPFKLANLISYADVLQYHLVIAHQHSLDPSDAHLKYLGTEDATVVEALTEDKATKDKYTADRNTLRDHLVEFLKYQEIRKKLTGDKKYLNGTTSVAGDGTLWIHGREDDIKTLLKQEGSLRDFISYPVVDYNVSRVGIGNHPQVPWYMKRQFCKYYLYQRDVMRSVILDGTYDVNGDGRLNDADIRYAYLKNDNGEYVDYDGNVVDKGEAIRLWMDEDKTSPAYEILWVSLFDESKWSDWSTDDEKDLSAGKIDASRKVEYPAGSGKYKKQPSGYVEGFNQQGQILTTLLPCHKNRKVVIDVVYEVNTDEFQFATSGRNTYAWYQMMTNNASSGMMNFSYKDGIGARTDRATHYTNNYLWAPEGDPYGFVLRSRYATVNGTGWNDVVVTTTGHLPKSTDYSTYDAATVMTSDATAFDATYTRRVGNNGGNLFDNKLIIHHLGGEELATNDGPANAIYEMFTGDATYSNSFLMHPTSSYIDLTNTTFQSYYMAHDTQTHKAKLVAGSANTLKNDNDANWRLLTTPEQLWPFFEYSGYVGGLEPLIAQNFSNMELHTQLKEYIDNPLMEREYSVLNRARKLVYTGKFYKRSGGELEASDPRPTAAEDLPVTFVPENLVQMKEGYYRIRGFSTDKLKAAETASGVYGPRYVSGYRFASEVASSKPLRYFETDQKNATIHTFGALTGFSDAPLQGNIELLPVEYDASSIFRFEALTDANSGVASDAFGRWVFGSQDLRVQVVGTPAENTPATTKMVAGTGTPFRLDDIGGATVTLRTFNSVPTNDDDGHTWDSDAANGVSKNIQTNYLTSNGSNNNSAYSLVVGADNELNQTETTDIQDTKWMLQPIGIRTSWPFNQTPLRVEVKKGGKDKTDKDDKYYYGSLCVPFDSRLGKTTDAAFTLVREMTGQSGTITMPSVSQYNGMGNPQYVPATWPVVMRTNQPDSVQMKNSDNSDYGGTRYYVDMYLPYTSPQTVSKASLNPLLMGEYLERTLDNTYMTGKTSGFTEPITSLTGKTIMVFGLPFKNHATHVYDTDAQVGWFKNHNWERETYHSVTANTATDDQRNNLYVCNNKVYYVMDTPSAGARELIVALFDEDVEPHEDEPIEETTTTKSVPWPCDVYDVQGRRVARHETPQTLLKNNPSLPKGVYIFGGRKVVIK